MKIVIAPDSFKESLHAAEVCAEIEAGLREVWPEAEYRKIPMADGGEGTVAAVVAAMQGKLVSTTVTGPMGEALTASFGFLPDGCTVILEMSAASGLEHVPLSRRNPLIATSYGTGELILAALDAGASRLIVGVGGSATVDGGAGMLQALGARLLDPAGRDIERGGAALAGLAHIDLTGLDPRLECCRIEVACDVNNPLIGPTGAASVFGPQKGATPEMVVALDKALANFAAVLATDLEMEVAGARGAGAAGGMGAALLACLRARMRPGVELVAELVGLETAIRDADLVITGEGHIDAQTANGKTAAGVAALAKLYRKPVIAFAGSLSVDAEELRALGIDAAFSIVRQPCSRDEAFASATANLRATARNVASALKAGMSMASGK